jgi:lantibiotic leader peptide-processing serine protease
MSKLRYLLLVVALVLPLALQSPIAMARQAAELPLEFDGSDEYLVVFGNSRVPAQAAAKVEAAGGQVVREIPQIGVLVVRGGADFAARAKGISGVVEVGTNGIWHAQQPVTMESVAITAESVEANDLYMEYQWDIKRAGGVPETWAIERGAGTIVAVLDSGVYWEHPDIAPNYLYGKSYVVDHIDPWGDPAPAEDANDYFGHGTAIAGTIAAPITQGRIIGIAPEAGIANYKVLTTFGYGYFDWILQAIVDAADDGVQVINMSFGYFVSMPDDGAATYVAFVRATSYAQQKGVLLVAAAGNEAIDYAKIRPIVRLPAGAPGVIAVSSTTSTDALAGYSNYGAGSFVAAPGGDDWDPYPFGNCAVAWSPITWIPFWAGQDYIYGSGTSLAAPKVAGVAALIYAQNPGISPAQVQALLFQTAEDIGEPGFDREFGHGLVHAYRALTGMKGRR